MSRRLDFPRQRYRATLRGPVTLFVVVLVLIVTLTVLWNVVLVHDYQALRALTTQAPAFHGTFLILGSALFLAIIVLSSILGAKLFGQIRWAQRQSDFIASVSHELNSPLSAIKLFAQTLRRRELPAEDLGFVDKILTDVERLQRLIANILRAAEIDDRGALLRVAPQSIDLGEYLTAYAEDARTLWGESGLELTVEVPERLLVRLDRMMFRQVLDNLVDNAVRYGGDHAPRVTIAAHAVGASAVIEVRDRGMGVEAGELPYLFDRFFRTETGIGTRRKGTGIGLFVVRSIVASHGGEIEARSDGPGRGTTMVVRLPRALGRQATAGGERRAAGGAAA